MVDFNRVQHMLGRVVRRALSTVNKKTSQELEKEFSQYKLLRKMETEKSYKVFNLRPPTEESKEKGEQPRVLMSDLASIKQYSHLYPHFLRRELQNKSSTLSASLTSNINRLFLMNANDGIELLLFLDAWGAITPQEIEMAGRWLHNQELSLQQIWLLLKSNLNMASSLQNRVIKHLDCMQVREYSLLFRILNYYRLKQLGDDSFFEAIVRHLIRNIEAMNGNQLVQMISHYTNNTSENMESKLSILEAVSNRLRILLKHLSAGQLVSILYCYMKLDMFKEDLAEDIQNVIIKSLPHWKQKEIKQLLEISTNMGRKQRPIIQQLISLFNSNKVPERLCPLLYSMAVEYGVLGKDVVRRMEEKLLDQVHTMTPEDVSRSCWSFAVVPREGKSGDTADRKIETYKLFFKRVVEIIEGGLREYTIKDVSRIVWAMSVKSFQMDAAFWKTIEFWLQQNLSRPSATVRDVSLILWAYTSQKPLHSSTVTLIKEIIASKLDQLEGFDVTMTCWFFSQINQQNPELMTLMYRKFVELLDSMELLEVIKCLRWFLQGMQVEERVLNHFVRRVAMEYMEKSYYTLLNAQSILVAVEIEDQGLKMDTVLKVDSQIQALKQLQTTS